MGAPLEYAGDRRYGVALCNELDNTADIVDGERPCYDTYCAPMHRGMLSIAPLW